MDPNSSKHLTTSGLFGEYEIFAYCVIFISFHNKHIPF